MNTRFENCVPGWAHQFIRENSSSINAIDKKLDFVIQLSALNIKHNSGGPFGAAIFEIHSGTPVSIGVNLVESIKCSHAHAEMVAIAIAQEKLQTYDLGGESISDHELVSSCEPCAMCFGAILWSGVKRVICGAKGEDAERIGFDEGPKPKNWVHELEKRGIKVIQEVRRNEAKKVFQDYIVEGRVIYNARRE